MKPPLNGTNADAAVTAAPRPPRRSAWQRLPPAIGVLALGLLLALPIALVNSVSVGADLDRNGVRFHAIEPWIWEFSSALGLLLWLLPLLRVDDALRARFAAWPARLALRVLASIAYSALHVATMVALRHAAYAVAGWHYRFGPLADAWLYEYRKDALTVALILGVAAAWRGAARGAGRDTVAWPPEVAAVPTPAAAHVPAPAPSALARAIEAAATPPTFLVRTAQGDLLVRADEVDWIEAQGNYVALHVRQEIRLLRQTLAEMEARLKDHGFIRTHRRALVNRLRMQAIIPPERGALGVRLASGEIAPLSESRRAEVLRLVLGA